jgi:hypothetical protein
MGATSSGGSEAGAPEGDTHAMTARKESVDHPAAGEDPPWHSAQAWRNIGATSVSNTGANAGAARSDEHPVINARIDATPQPTRPERDTYCGRVGKLAGALPVSEKIES